MWTSPPYSTRKLAAVPGSADRSSASWMWSKAPSLAQEVAELMPTHRNTRSCLSKLLLLPYIYTMLYVICYHIYIYILCYHINTMLVVKVGIGSFLVWCFSQSANLRNSSPVGMSPTRSFHTARIWKMNENDIFNIDHVLLHRFGNTTYIS